MRVKNLKRYTLKCTIYLPSSKFTCNIYISLYLVMLLKYTYFIRSYILKREKHPGKFMIKPPISPCVLISSLKWSVVFRWTECAPFKVQLYLLLPSKVHLQQFFSLSYIISFSLSLWSFSLAYFCSVTFTSNWKHLLGIYYLHFLVLEVWKGKRIIAYYLYSREVELF